MGCLHSDVAFWQVIIVHILYTFNIDQREKGLHFLNRHSSLNSILVQIWIDLGQGVVRARHPFHTPALASQADSGPDVRTVVLRHVDPSRRRLLCHTDFRSPKVGELQASPDVAWLFYDPGNKTQLRIKGRVQVHHEDELARARWEQSTTRSRQCYHAAYAPGTPGTATLAAEPLEAGFDNFAVIDCTVTSIDWLYLRSRGHLRARFEWQDITWHSQWIAP